MGMTSPYSRSGKGYTASIISSLNKVSVVAFQILKSKERHVLLEIIKLDKIQAQRRFPQKVPLRRVHTRASLPERHVPVLAPIRQRLRRRSHARRCRRRGKEQALQLLLLLSSRRRTEEDNQEQEKAAFIPLLDTASYCLQGSTLVFAFTHSPPAWRNDRRVHK